MGCGPGWYAAWLIEHGAQVVGLDISTQMVEQARQRLGDQARFYQHDLSEPQPEKAAAEIDPATYRELMEHPAFIAFRLRK